MLEMYINIVDAQPIKEMNVSKVVDHGNVIAEFDPLTGAIDLEVLKRRVGETIKVYHNDIYQGDFTIKAVVKDTTTGKDDSYAVDLEPVK